MADVRFQTGDLIFVRGGSWISKAIRWFSRQPKESKTYTNHVAIFKNGSTISEAKLEVVETPVERWISLTPQFEIWRYNHLTSQDMKKIKLYLEDYKGSTYGVGKIFLFGLDFGITKIFRKECRFFRRFQFLEDFPICSWLGAFSYQKALIKFCGNDPKYLDPDTMHDCVLKSPTWHRIYKKG